MEPENLTVRVLVEIRDEMRGLRNEVRATNERLDQTNERLDQTNERLDQTNERLGAVEHAVRDMASQLVFIGRSLGVTRSKGRKHGARLDDLERRVGALEKDRT